MPELDPSPQPPQRIKVSALITEMDWRSAAPVMQVLRPSLKVDEFILRREQLLADGYRLLGLQVDDRVMSLASYTISPHVTYGRQLLVHDMATLPDAQGQGYATHLIDKLVQISTEEGCGRIFVHTRKAQSFYARCGFSEYSTGMIRETNV